MSQKCQNFNYKEAGYSGLILLPLYAALTATLMDSPCLEEKPSQSNYVSDEEMPDSPVLLLSEGEGPEEVPTEVTPPSLGQRKEVPHELQELFLDVSSVPDYQGEGTCQHFGKMASCSCSCVPRGAC